MPLDDHFLAALEWIAPVRRSEPMARHTTMNVGGPAPAYVAAADCARLEEIARLAREWDVPLLILGGGSNLLVSDAGVDALVVETWSNAASVETQTEPTDRASLTVYAGMPLPRLAYQAAEAGFSGLEWAVGVPGTVGGGIINNAGAHGGQMADVVQSVRVLHDGEERRLAATDLAYGYRSSSLRPLAEHHQQPVILEADLALTRAPRDVIQSRIAGYVAHRRSTQPSQRSVGSIFKNPPEGHTAGWLIEQAGLKGLRAGDAEISTKHGNFIVNRGRARADEVNELIRQIQTTVQQKFDVRLELEIQRVGF